MGYKPLAGISFSELQSLLGNLTLITMDNEQVYTINPAGFTFDSGEITMNDPPAGSVEITAHLADTPIHGDHVALDAQIAAIDAQLAPMSTQLAGLKRYGLKCLDTPAVTGIAPTPYPFTTCPNLDLLVRFRLDAALGVGDHFFWKAKTQTATRFAFGLRNLGSFNTMDFFCDLGQYRYACPNPSGFFTSALLGQWLQFGLSYTGAPSPSLTWLWNGKTTATEGVNNSGLIAPDGDDLIDVGCVGITLGMLAVVLKDGINLFAPSVTVPPYPVQRPAHSVNYWNFQPIVTPGIIPDLAIPTTYQTSLHVQYSGEDASAEFEEINIV